jgi:flavin prenyltransferase
MQHDSSSKKKIILGITGASGSVYGLRLLEILLEKNFEVHLIISDNAKKVMAFEEGFNLLEKNLSESKKLILKKLSIQKNTGLKLWDINNIAASIASGSFKTTGMVLAPASMGSIANIALGTSNNLITRAADVCLKEKRTLILVARESPLNSIHLRNMLSLSEMGAVILPASPAFYHKPQNLEDQVMFIVGKVLDSLGIENNSFLRWSDDRNQTGKKRN